ncbi:MAG: 4Fe-4S binding protein [Halobacteriota archaeon]
MIISVAAGKGGTGKTLVATSLALSIDNVQFLDCDVEEPDAHILLRPEISSRKPVFIPVPRVDEEICDGCGKCSEGCVYHAIAVIKGRILIFPELCHGCGVCVRLCPENAISEEGMDVGMVERGGGKAKGVEFIQGKLDIGMPMPTPVIRDVKRGINPKRTVIIDVAPGTSCPMAEAVKDTDFCILVTLTPHHLGNMFNSSLSSIFLTFFGTSVIMLRPLMIDMIDLAIFEQQINRSELAIESCLLQELLQFTVNVER